MNKLNLTARQRLTVMEGIARAHWLQNAPMEAQVRAAATIVALQRDAVIEEDPNTLIAKAQADPPRSGGAMDFIFHKNKDKSKSKQKPAEVPAAQEARAQQPTFETGMIYRHR